jgi:hypothetical protein
MTGGWEWHEPVPAHPSFRPSGPYGLTPIPSDCVSKQSRYNAERGAEEVDHDKHFVADAAGPWYRT